MAINKISDKTKDLILRKSAKALPNNPSGRGMSAEEIKKAFYAPLTDTANSIVGEANRIVEEINKALEGFVLAEDGKILSDNNFSEEYKTKLDNLENYDDTELREKILDRYTKLEVDALLNKKASHIELSEAIINSNKYTDERIAQLIDSAPETLDTFKEIAEAFAEDQQILDTLNAAIGSKVTKEDGKGLSTNDYTDDEKEKLSTLSNYDDSEIKSLIETKEKSIIDQIPTIYLQSATLDNNVLVLTDEKGNTVSFEGGSGDISYDEDTAIDSSEIDIRYANVVSDAIADNIASLNEYGNLADSGISKNDIVTVNTNQTITQPKGFSTFIEFLDYTNSNPSYRTSLYQSNNHFMIQGRAMDGNMDNNVLPLMVDFTNNMVIVSKINLIDL